MQSTQRISIVIVTYNTGGLIRECLRSVTQLGDNVEVIVVDNASKDETPNIIANEFPTVKLIINANNSGFGAGNNLGFQHATADYLVLVNPDLILSQDALRSMIDYLAAHPEVGIVGPRTLEADGDIAPTARARYSLLRLIAKYWGLDRLSPQLVYGKYLHLVQTAKSPFQADWLQGSCLVMQRAFYAELNGFDEDFFLFMEDADLCERAKAAGKVNVYLPDAQVMHHGSTTVSRFPLIRVRSYHQSPIHYFRKRGQTGAVWVLKWAFTLELLTKIIFRSLRNLIQQDSIVHAKQQAEWTVLRELWGY